MAAVAGALSATRREQYCPRTVRIQLALAPHRRPGAFNARKVTSYVMPSSGALVLCCMEFKGVSAIASRSSHGASE